MLLLLLLLLEGLTLLHHRPRPPAVRNNRESWLFLETAWLRTDCVCLPAKEKDKMGERDREKEIFCWGRTGGRQGAIRV